MKIQLENDTLKAEILSKGAELKSLVTKEDGQEYLWEADPAFWGKTSPILFPFIGKLEGAAYLYNDRRYEMEKHGFARDMDFSVKEQEKDRVVFFIKSTEETLRKYPFPFCLEVEYCLGENGIEENVKVYNVGTETMYYSLGGHPAFACPLVMASGRVGSRRDSFIRLYGVEDQKEVEASVISVPQGFITGETYRVALENNTFPVTEHTFDQDAVVLASQGVTAVGIVDKNGKEYVHVETDCPVWGIWSMPDQAASYICIEPWWGICDSEGYKGTVQERPYTNTLKPGETKEHKIRITVGK